MLNLISWVVRLHDAFIGFTLDAKYFLFLYLNAGVRFLVFMRTCQLHVRYNYLQLRLFLFRWVLIQLMSIALKILYFHF